MSAESFAERLKALMDWRGFNNARLAEESGITPAEISRILSGERKEPGIGQLNKLASALSCRYEYLGRGTGPMWPTGAEPTGSEPPEVNDRRRRRKAIELTHASAAGIRHPELGPIKRRK